MWELHCFIGFALVPFGLGIALRGSVKLAHCALIWRRNVIRGVWSDTPGETPDDLKRAGQRGAIYLVIGGAFAFGPPALWMFLFRTVTSLN